MIASPLLEVENRPQDVVEGFFARLESLLEGASVLQVDRPSILGYWKRSLQEDHLLAATSDPDSYLATMEDLLLTASQLTSQDSPTSQELLVDWVVNAPAFAMERLNPDAWVGAANLSSEEAWEDAGAQCSRVGDVIH